MKAEDDLVSILDLC
nr:hypothetical protein [Tanacetum cinerariifolium]